MILLDGPDFDDQSGRRFLVLLFGNGLIGSEVVAQLVRRGLTRRWLPFRWGDRGAREADTRALLAQIEARCPAPDEPERDGEEASIAVVWAAGRGGFLTTDTELVAEMDDFAAVVGIAERLQATRPRCRHGFHLVSSAGGLFEGQTQVGPASAPRPLRAYGRSKWQQEQHLRHALPCVVQHFYRPTSVYGAPARGRRAGLISTLLSNGIQRRETHFIGRMDTLRDYVSNIDVARYIAGRVLAYHAQGGTFMLASARPVSLFQLKALAERTIGRKIYASYASELTNSADMGFLPSCLPDDWHFRDVETGMRQIAQSLLLR
jgi:UDP-glucose 4-epimerase